MHSTLKTDESVGLGLRRICLQHARKALAGLKKAKRPAAIHDVRKELKKLRAVFQLARARLGSRQFRKLTRTMRLAAKPLGALRDARVTYQALTTLADPKNVRRFPRIRSALRTHSLLEKGKFKENQSDAVSKFLLKRVYRQLHALKLKPGGWGEIQPCLKRNYRKGCDAFHLAVRQPTPAHWHAWRKAVKNLLYQLEFLCGDWPRQTRVWVDGLNELGEHLGTDHDYVLLRQFVEDHCGPGKDTAELKRLIDSKRRDLARGCRRLGSQLYGQKPGKLCARLKRDWKKGRRG